MNESSRKVSEGVSFEMSITTHHRNAPVSCDARYHINLANFNQQCVVLSVIDTDHIASAAEER